MCVYCEVDCETNIMFRIFVLYKHYIHESCTFHVLLRECGINMKLGQCRGIINVKSHERESLSCAMEWIVKPT